MRKKILISTGGSGGHTIPATIFYEHLKDEFDLYLTSDKRGIRFINLKKYTVKVIDVPKLKNNFIFLPINSIILIFAIIKSLFYLKKNKIDILITTGGYMSLPYCIAGKFLNIKIYLFEPNMVIGRANSFFLKYCIKIFCYSKEIKNYPKNLLNKIQIIDPLLRKEFYLINRIENNSINNEINLLIIGGSQGAKLFDTGLKSTIIYLSNKYKLKIIQQSNLLNFQKLKDFYIKNNIEHQLFNYEEDILKYIKNINFCITRAGASSLAELTFLNIPYLAIPLPSAKDDHQLHNALFYESKNCCWLLKQDELKKDQLTNSLIKIIDNKDDYSIKKNNMKKFSSLNNWNNINKKIIEIINEN